jgi:hypothetical protein
LGGDPSIVRLVPWRGYPKDALRVSGNLIEDVNARRFCLPVERLFLVDGKSDGSAADREVGYNVEDGS